MGDKSTPYTGQIFKEPPSSVGGERTPYTGKILSEPPAPVNVSGETEYEQKIPWSTALGSMVVNAAPSLVKNVEGMATGLYDVASDPVAAGRGLYSLAQGTESMLGGPKEYVKAPVGAGKVDALGQPIISMGMQKYRPMPRQETPEQTAQREALEAPARAFWTELGAPYQSIESFKQTLATDPARIVFDAMSLGPGAIRKGAAAAATGVAKTPVRIGGNIVHTLTGANAESLRDAIRAGKLRETQFIDAIEGKIDLTEAVTLAQKGLRGMKDERNTAYRVGLSNGLFKDPAVLDFKQIDQSLGAAERQRWWKQFRQDRPNPKIEAEVNNLIDSWRALPPAEYHTAEGLDTLKKAINKVYDRVGYGERNQVDRRFVATSAAAIKDVIEQKFPGYAEVMKNYGEASDAIDEITRAMSLGDRATADSGLRKLLSAYRNNANTNYGNRLRMVEELEAAGAKGLRSTLAGAQLAKSRGIGRVGHTMAYLTHPETMLAEPFLQPELYGKLGYTIGGAQRSLRDLADAVVPQVVRGSIMDVAQPALTKGLRFAPQLGEFAQTVLPQE
jgi:hypothetical protein